MAATLESVFRTAPQAAAHADTLPDLAGELSRRLHRLVPHDGHMLSGTDPVTGAGCFLTEHNGYTCDHFRRVKDGEMLSPGGRRSLVTVLGTGVPTPPGSAPLLDLMAGEGWGGEMRLALVGRGVLWGTLVLLRERGRPPFTPADVDGARRVVAPLAESLRRYVTRGAPHPARSTMAPGVLIVDEADAITSVTPTGRDWLRLCFPNLTLDTDDDLSITLWNFAAAARQENGAVLSRVPTADGWVALQAQHLAGARHGEVAITVQSATAGQLLPAVTAWYGITTRERAVIEQVLDGRSSKQIARSLDLSQHTTNDHLKAIYRKIQVSGRSELFATLSR
ncbi:LuxR family transcriptional regulator [Actinomadura sp. DC4]|uniref:helix-turn-helix transcriptional regulator n=1 Tax=Actinomadura sp. DC4 TaxID=3055069 RepID=UPI0025B0625E|nr:LuxR family transcriptional regulator [Actinomadura sp. DC4]MDN3353619.1 LuxR C-terminal-related transcriptional regulator [Actinomadura sp. DC4]